MTVKIRLGGKKPIQPGLFEMPLEEVTDDAILQHILESICNKCDGGGHVMGDYRRLILCPKCHGRGRK